MNDFNNISNVNPSIIRSVSNQQEEILNFIKTLYCPEGFECDITFGKGNFWRKIMRPKLSFDIEPLKPNVVKASSTCLPLEADSMGNIVFDPPFITYVKNGRQGNNAKTGMRMAQQFGGYWSYNELETHYKQTLTEVSRILKPKGILVFKCQDIIHNHKMFCTHTNIINWAKNDGLELEDLFILLGKNRFPKPNKTGKQQHARVSHSYFLVFRKTGKLNKKMGLGTITSKTSLVY